MTAARLGALLALAVALGGGALRAQEPEREAPPTWEFAASAYGYFVPESQDFLLPTFTADRDWLHLEARYNYEALDTGSVWFGYNLSFGEKVTFDFTPMIGGVFGDVDGIAPGFKATLAWKGLELYSESEIVFDREASTESFVYTWSELSWAPRDWFRFGLVGQRTRVYESERDVQRGLLVGFSYKILDISAYLLNPDDDNPLGVVSLTVSF